jgi:hypothetical protein
MIAALAERAWLQPLPGEPTLAWGLSHDPGYALAAARVARWRGVAGERIDTALANQVGPDGDYAEGANYAAYGGEPLAACLAMRRRLEAVDLYAAGVQNMPLWLRDQVVADMDFGVFNFNDSLSACRPATVLLAQVTAYTRDPAHMGILREALDHADASPPLGALVALDASIEATPVVVSRCSVYQRTGQVIWRDGEGRAGRSFAIMCGAHGGAHQHRDRGGFWLSAHGQRLLVDTGDCRHMPVPDPDFADTIAHNCLLIDGRGQVIDYAAPVAGALVEHQHDEAGLRAVFAAGACYPGVADYRRALAIDRDSIRLTDTVAMADGSTPALTWLGQGYNADGRGAWTVDGDTATFRRPGVQLRIRFHAPPTRVRVVVGAMDDSAGGILRLEATFAGPSVDARLTVHAL